MNDSNISNEIKERLYKLIYQKCEDKIVKDRKMKYLMEDYKFDSVTIFSLIVEIEDEFDIEIEDEYLVIEKLNNIDKLVEIIKKHRF